MKRLLVILSVLLLLTFTLARAQDATPEAQPATIITDLAWSPDGTMIVGSGTNGFLRLWNLIDETFQDCPDLFGSVRTVAWNPDSSRIVSGGDDNLLRIWDTNCNIITTFQHQNVVTSASWSPDGTMIATASLDPTGIYPTLRIWDVATEEILAETGAGQLTQVVWHPQMSVSEVAVSNVNNNVAIVSIDQIDSRISRLALLGDARQMAVSWSPDGTILASGDDEGTIYLWDAISGALITTFSANTEAIGGVKWHPNATLLAVASFDSYIRIWDTSDHTIVEDIYTNASYAPPMDWSPAGTQLAYVADDETLNIVEPSVIPNETPATTLIPTLVQTPTSQAIIDLAWSPDGTMILGGGTDGFLRLWDTSGLPLRDCLGVTLNVNAVAWSPDSAYILTGGDDTQLRIWDTNCNLVTTLEHSNRVVSVAWSPDGSEIASVSDDHGGDITLIIWDGSTYVRSAELRSGSLSQVVWNPNSGISEVAVSNTNDYVSIKQSDPPNLVSREAFEGNAGQMSVSWSPNGDSLASGDYNGTVYIWDAIDGGLVTSFNANTSIIGEVAWSPDGMLLAVASFDGYIRIWDVNDSTIEAVIYTGGSRLAPAMDWSPDGTHFVYSTTNATITVLPAPFTIPNNLTPTGN